MTPSPGFVIPSRAWMFQCRVSALSFVVGLPTSRVPRGDVRTWLRSGVANCEVHYREVGIGGQPVALQRTVQGFWVGGFEKKKEV